jgi:hypothetical protein
MDNFDHFKEEWDAIESPAPESHEEIMWMCDPSNHPRIKGMKRKLLREAILIIAFCAVVGLLADLLTAPWWLNLAFVVSLSLYFFTDFLGYVYLKTVPMEGSVKDAIIKFRDQMKRIEILSESVTALVGMTTISVLVMRVPLVANYPVLWAAMFGATVLTGWLSSRKWAQRVVEMQELIDVFEEDEAFDEDEGYEEVEEFVIR